MVEIGWHQYQQFKRLNNTSDTRIRRKKLRGAGGEITVATPPTNAVVKEELKKKVSSGEYSVGQLIAPRKVKYVHVHYPTTALTKCY